MKTLAKMKTDKWLGGVCSGIAYSFALPVWLIRLCLALLFVSYGVGGFAYVLLWIFMPAWHVEPADYRARTYPSTAA